MKLHRQELLENLINTYGTVTVLQDMASILRQNSRDAGDDHITGEKWRAACNAVTELTCTTAIQRLGTI